MSFTRDLNAERLHNFKMSATGTTLQISLLLFVFYLTLVSDVFGQFKTEHDKRVCRDGNLYRLIETNVFINSANQSDCLLIPYKWCVWCDVIITLHL